jgi:thioredoxin 1
MDGIHTETKERVIVYDHLYPHEHAVYVRPRDNFYGKLEDGVTLRFDPLHPVSSVSDDTFEEEVLNAPGITLIDFWAPWCGPCKMLIPVLEKVAKQFYGQVKVVKMNVDDNQIIPGKYGVRGIPNMIAFVGGQQVVNAIGAKSQSQVTAIFEKLIAQYGKAE